MTDELEAVICVKRIIEDGAISMVARSIAHSERTSSTMIDRGLYLLRYVSTASVNGAPLVHVRASVGSEHLVLLVAAPDAPPISLTKPGTALVIRAESAVNLQITLQAPLHGGSLDAELKLERIDGPHAHDTPVRQMASPPIGSAVQALELRAHVSRRGDVSVAAGRWIAGPEAPTPIEGISALWPADHGQTLEYQVLMEGNANWSEWLSNGRYAGTRGEFRSLVGVRFRLTAPGPHTLRASALFLGSAVIEKSGVTIELRSAAGFDPLVGLLLESVATIRPVAPPARASEPGYVQPESRGRVRVFRAGGEHS